MSLSSKPSVWFGVTLVLALVVVVLSQKEISSPHKVGGLWITPAEDGFIVHFQFIDKERKTVPAKGVLNIFVGQLIYPTSDEVGSKFGETYPFSPEDFDRGETSGGGKKSYTFCAATPVILYNSFNPPTEKGVLCRIELSFLDYSQPDVIERLKIIKQIRI